MFVVLWLATALIKDDDGAFGRHEGLPKPLVDFARGRNGRKNHRGLAMLEAAFLCDAATTGLHWIYDPDRIAALVRRRSPAVPEFYDPPSSPFYKASPVAPTPYGDELRATVRAMAMLAANNSSHGGLEPLFPAFFARSYLAYTRDACAADFGCPRARLNGLSKAFLACMIQVPLARLQHRANTAEPVGSTRISAQGAAAQAAAAAEDETLLAARRWQRCPSKEERLGNNQAHAVVRAVAIAARFGGVVGQQRRQQQLLLRQQAEQAIRMLQDNSDAVQYGLAAVTLLDALLRGAAMRPALVAAKAALHVSARQAVEGVLTSVHKTAERDGGCANAASVHRDAVQRLGSACELPGMFLSSVHGIALAAVCAEQLGQPADLAAAVRATIMAGGDQASRSLFIGAALTAAGSDVPAAWRARATTSTEVRDGIALAKTALLPHNMPVADS